MYSLKKNFLSKALLLGFAWRDFLEPPTKKNGGARLVGFSGFSVFPVFRFFRFPPIGEMGFFGFVGCRLLAKWILRFYRLFHWGLTVSGNVDFRSGGFLRWPKWVCSVVPIIPLRQIGLVGLPVLQFPLLHPMSFPFSSFRRLSKLFLCLFVF